MPQLFGTWRGWFNDPLRCLSLISSTFNLRLHSSLNWEGKRQFGSIAETHLDYFWRGWPGFFIPSNKSSKYIHTPPPFLCFKCLSPFDHHCHIIISLSVFFGPPEFLFCRVFIVMNALCAAVVFSYSSSQDNAIVFPKSTNQTRAKPWVISRSTSNQTLWRFIVSICWISIRKKLSRWLLRRGCSFLIHALFSKGERERWGGIVSSDPPFVTDNKAKKYSFFCPPSARWMNPNDDPRR